MQSLAESVLLPKLRGVRKSGDGWTARCPAHRDHRASLSVGTGDDGRALLTCHAGCDSGMVLQYLGLTFSDITPPRADAGNGRSRRRANPPPAPMPVAIDEDAPPDHKARVGGATRYEIRDRSGDLVAIHVRRDFDDGRKAFHWEQPDGAPGLNGTRTEDLPLYGIHRLGTSPYVVVTEGEPAAQALRDLNIAAVGTVTGAAGCPCDDSLRPLLGQPVVLWPDHDDPGEGHMDRIATRLRKLGLKAGQCFRVDWPDAPAKGDAKDWAAGGGTKDAFRDLAKAAPVWQSRSAPAGAGAACAGTGAVSSTGLLGGKAPSQATMLADMVTQSDADLFHDSAGTAYVSFTVGGHRETHPLHSRTVRDWLSHQFYTVHETSPGGHALATALATLGGAALFEGEQREVAVRLASHGGDTFLDLGTQGWDVVQITAHGWHVIPANDAPVRFRRSRGLLPLPAPRRGGDLAPLRDLLNVRDDDGFTLIVGWLVGTLNPRGTYPILALTGEQGSCKSTAARLLRSCLDPNVAPLRASPREEGDILIAAQNGLIVCYDNLSTLPDWMSDAVCRLTSGAGISKRQLYTDSDEIVLDARRPVLLTGISSVLSRGDAIDRAVMVEMGSVEATDRRTDEDVHAAFSAAWPDILGALLDAASAALRNLADTHLGEMPRLADFARWVEAAAPALGWEAEQFLGTYGGNRASADEIAVDASPVGPAVLAFLADLDGGTWEGTASELLAALTAQSGEATRDRGWPKKGVSLSAHLKRIAPHLRRLGIAVEIGVREAGGQRRLVRMSGKSRHDRHGRHNPHSHADARDTGSSQGSSQVVTASSQDRRESSQSRHSPDEEAPHNHADFRDEDGFCDDCDDDSPLSPHHAGSGEPGDDRWTR